MTVSVLLRLVSDTLTSGRVAGHAEVVETGETAMFKDPAEMLQFLRRVSTQGGLHKGMAMHRTVTTGQRPRRRLIGARAGSLVLSALLLGVAPVTVRAATLTVTYTNGAGSGSLRAAITAANGTPAADAITFALPGSGV